jgi:hypothetical protein
MNTTYPNASAVLNGAPRATGHVADRAADRGSRPATVADLTAMLGDTKGCLLTSGGLLIAGALGFTAVAAWPASRWGGAELGLLGPLGLLVLLGWLRAAVLLALADRPVADALGLLRWRTGAPVDLMVPWVPSGLDRLTSPDPGALHALIAGARLRHERAHRALRWAVIATTAVCVWTVLVIAWAATS